jgi:lipopolysaccharide transport system permease protein
MATAKTVLESPQSTPTEPPETPPNAADLPETLIEAGSRRWVDDLKEIWLRRELLYFLIWRDIKVRYRDTLLSAGWALVQPAVMTVIFTVFLGPKFGVNGEGSIPYPLYVYSGFLAWNFFASAITGASMSVVVSESLITKVYFPRLILPLATVGTNLVDLLIGLVGLVGLMVFYRDQVTPGWSLLLLPVWVILCALAGMGVGTFWAALNVRYKDFRFVVPYLMQVWFFATPSIFAPPTTSNDAPDATIFGSHALYTRLRELPEMINPVNSLIVSFRSVALGGEAPWGYLGVAAIVIAILLVIGCLYFRKVEDIFADVI